MTRSKRRESSRLPGSSLILGIRTGPLSRMFLVRSVCVIEMNTQRLRAFSIHSPA
jgi:hypothetical protein